MKCEGLPVVAPEVGAEAGSEEVEILCIVVENGDLAALKKRATLEGPNNLRYFLPSALHLAICFNQQQIFDFVLEHPNLNMHTNPLGRCLLLGLAKSRNLPGSNNLNTYFIERLLQSGVNVNARDKTGWTCVQIGCYYRDEELIDLLLRYGADASIMSPQGLQPFENAVKYCSPNTLELLFSSTFNGLEAIELPLRVLTVLMTKGQVLQTMVLQRVTSVILPENPNLLAAEVQQLFNLPFEVFTSIVQKFMNVVDNIRKVSLTSLLSRSPDALDYVKFICDRCKNLEKFSGTVLLRYPDKIPVQMIEKLFLKLLSHDIPVTIDFHYMYKIYGFSSLLENLLGCKIQKVEKPECPLFVPVWCNTRMSSNVSSEANFKDKKHYFSKKGEVSSLLQLSRDATRKHFTERYDIENYAQFKVLMEKLSIYGIFKDILTYKMPIYF